MDKKIYSKHLQASAVCKVVFTIYIIYLIGDSVDIYDRPGSYKGYSFQNKPTHALPWNCYVYRSGLLTFSIFEFQKSFHEASGALVTHKIYCTYFARI